MNNQWTDWNLNLLRPLLYIRTVLRLYRRGFYFMTYSEKLKEKQWADKRRVILKRDNNECQMCMSTINLHVHHKKYIDGRDPWNYTDNYLITICSVCHNKHHYKKDRFKKDKSKPKRKISAEERTAKYEMRKMNTEFYKRFNTPD